MHHGVEVGKAHRGAKVHYRHHIRFGLNEHSLLKCIRHSTELAYKKPFNRLRLKIQSKICSRRTLAIMTKRKKNIFIGLELVRRIDALVWFLHDKKNEIIFLAESESVEENTNQYCSGSLINSQHLAFDLGPHSQKRREIGTVYLIILSAANIRLAIINFIL